MERSKFLPQSPSTISCRRGEKSIENTCQFLKRGIILVYQVVEDLLLRRYARLLKIVVEVLWAGEVVSFDGKGEVVICLLVSVNGLLHTFNRNHIDVRAAV